MVSKSELGIILSRLKGFHTPKVRLEQYMTEPEIAADMLWKALYLGDIQGKNIGDMGCGTGILGLGALLLGTKSVYMVDSDPKALEIAKINLHTVKSESSFKGKAFIKEAKIEGLSKKFDVVLQNPPFGVIVRHADKAFLEKAMQLAPIIYSFHKSESLDFIRSFSKDNGYSVTHVWNYDFPLKSTLEYHKKRIQRVKVSCFRLERKSF